jgi:hypothetical protein
VSTTDTAFSYTVSPSSPQKPNTWITLLERPLKLNCSLTIQTEKLVSVSENHGSLLFVPSKNFQDMTPDPLGCSGDALSIALALRLKTDPPRLLVPKTLSRLSFNFQHLSVLTQAACYLLNCSLYSPTPTSNSHPHVSHSPALFSHVLRVSSHCGSDCYLLLKFFLAHRFFPL